MHHSVVHKPVCTMVEDDAATNGDRLEGEKELDLKMLPSEDTDGDVGKAEMGVCASETPSPPEEARKPREWKWAVIFLCFYGFMASVKPGEPFITPYLLSPEKNFTRKEVGDVQRPCRWMRLLQIHQRL